MGALMKPQAPEKRYETPVIIDLGAITKGDGACKTGSRNARGICRSGGVANPCNTGSGG